MAFTLYRFVQTRWTSSVNRISTAWRIITRARHDKVPAQQDRGERGRESIDSIEDVTWPFTDEQREVMVQKFFDSIDQDAVCALASRHNGHKSCQIDVWDKGSFNICFIVKFNTDNTKWVVRIPIGPVVHNAWDKLESEVITMRYIKTNTNIPLPTIHEYGQDRTLTKTSSATPFLILDYIPGKSLDIKALLEATLEQRKGFFAELIEVLAHLRRLEFSEAGSLVPDPHGGPNPVVGKLFSIPINELQTMHRRKQYTLPASVSATEFVGHRYDVISTIYNLPQKNQSQNEAMLELFALDSLRKLISNFIDKQCDNGPFILSHLDLGYGNIIVDNDFHIQGIIDWEWAGHNPDLWNIQNEFFSEFYDVLQEKSQTSDCCNQLVEDWDSHQKLTLPIAQILHHPSHLARIYYRAIYPTLFDCSYQDTVSEFYENNAWFSSQVEGLVDHSDRFTQYLKNSGLYSVKERDPQVDKKIKEQNQEIDELLKELSLLGLEEKHALL
ncbi:hypothetical protein PT974_12165 [Cladobotryum mycophilum]|uniref:Aminoglycoside phosphotransferase domain-containing protein n=1 Tax=Cladobotryum mycophilum TaxID=491253 RepID=A0ABR0S789_9HYPO